MNSYKIGNHCKGCPKFLEYKQPIAGNNEEIIGKCCATNSELSETYIYLIHKCPFNPISNNPLRIWCKVWNKS